MNEVNQTTGDETYESTYMILKKEYQNEITSWIQESEKELADLYLRKKLLAANFKELLEQYQTIILQNQEVSTIAKTNLLEYFSYELLLPFHSIGLEGTEHYNTWETKQFFVAYQLDEQGHLIFYFKLKVLDDRFVVDYIPLVRLDMQEMTVTIEEKQVQTLISLWFSDHFLSRSQLSLFNHDLNRLLIHLRELGFTVAPSLLDNTQPLSFHLVSDFPLTSEILDEIFIKTMASKEYDFNKLEEQTYQVQLNQEQNVIIHLKETQTELYIDSNERRRSILDFVTSYPFLVPLIVPGKEK
ncbi:hypothetical protein [Enterococcus lemanii]|uniref:Uncharacterized protein n=1 Tax=Enterococcus lemanii TaxID=1159752 RepID=A0ABV9MYA1_9ENTE|nr:hypothetical protein [Enterococcus lemanii]MBM7709629.1 hypothetical protein [Enterococcus lemanii]